MSEVSVEDISDAAAAALLAPHFAAMYRYFAQVSGHDPLREDAFRHWLGAYGPPTAGKSRLICAARAGGDVVGFAEGLLRAPPAYFQPGWIGFVAHLHVVPEWRQHGVATRLMKRLRAWFRERGVRQIQLHVVQGNLTAAAFWSAQGFEPELQQMRCYLE
ncbi:MAG TPA: GNAT family N-acetyltransferase [Falsiroseomonas sp.]|jgi:GNAT superfamily N-acetyltransferase|nr:GNAT family N-acetyltransferase [Falsiroseomonas sp.]